MARAKKRKPKTEARLVAQGYHAATMYPNAWKGIDLSSPLGQRGQQIYRREPTEANLPSDTGVNYSVRPSRRGQVPGSIHTAVQPGYIGPPAMVHNRQVAGGPYRARQAGGIIYQRGEGRGEPGPTFADTGVRYPRRTVTPPARPAVKKKAVPTPAQTRSRQIAR